MSSKQRCINLDWLEIYCIEPSFLSSEQFREDGWEVELRPYGTPMYREMFTLLKHGFKFLEIRRDPYQARSKGGIFEDGSCHIRLCNRTCYFPDPVGELREFLVKYGYEYKGITRADICCDFLQFDRGDKPQGVINDFMTGKISKINQCNVSAHGRDLWDGRYWNSLKWGSECSMITTKLYNKTMELSREGHDKFYIRDCWEQAGLCSKQVTTYVYKNKDGTEVQRYGVKYVPFGTAVKEPVPQESVKEVQVWRVEFAIHSNAKHWINLENGQFYDFTLTSIDNRSKLLYLFHTLAHRFFHFKKLVKNKNGGWQRKDRCPDKVLFITNASEHVFKPTTMPTTQTDVPNWIKHLIADLKKLYNSPHVSSLVSAAALQIMKELFDDHRVWTGDLSKTESVYNLDKMTKSEIESLYVRLKNIINPKEQNIF